LSKTVPQMSEARRYQQLRAHLSYLKLGDAAEHLPRILDGTVKLVSWLVAAKIGGCDRCSIRLRTPGISAQNRRNFGLVLGAGVRLTAVHALLAFPRVESGFAPGAGTGSDMRRSRGEAGTARVGNRCWC
jgi:hypothetical protein